MISTESIIEILRLSPSTVPLGHEPEAEWLRAVSPSTLLRTMSLSNGMSNGPQNDITTQSV